MVQATQHPLFAKAAVLCGMPTFLLHVVVSRCVSHESDYELDYGTQAAAGSVKEGTSLKENPAFKESAILQLLRHLSC